MKKLLLSVLLACGFVSTQASEAKQEELYPFSSHPNLSWKAFEQDFRQKYDHVDIPPIEVTDLSWPYFYEVTVIETSDSFGSTWFYKGGKICCNPRISLSPDHVELALLHECGHHNYPKKLKANNTNDARQAVHSGMESLTSGLSKLQKGLMVGNAYHIFFRKPCIRLLGMQGIVTALLSNPDVSRSLLKSTVGKSIDSKREECAADAFANQHASMQALYAGYYLFSKDGHNQFLRKCREFEPIKKEKTDDYTKKIFYGLLEEKCSYPSLQERQAMVAQALKDRFGVDVHEASPNK